MFPIKSASGPKAMLYRTPRICGKHLINRLQKPRQKEMQNNYYHKNKLMNSPLRKIGLMFFKSMIPTTKEQKQPLESLAAAAAAAASAVSTAAVITTTSLHNEYLVGSEQHMLRSSEQSSDARINVFSKETDGLLSLWLHMT
jgi:hypothetical protein